MVVLAVVYGKTAEEISESERIPLGTAKTRIRAGLLKLRVALVDDESVGRWPTLAGEGSA